MISRKKLAQLAAETRGSAPLPRTLPGLAPLPKLANGLTPARPRPPAKKAALPKTERRKVFGKPCRVCGQKRGMGELKRAGRVKIGDRKVALWQCLAPCVGR